MILNYWAAALGRWTSWGRLYRTGNCRGSFLKTSVLACDAILAQITRISLCMGILAFEP